MTTFTIHTDDVMAEAIRRGAAEAGVSINKFIQNAIDVTLGVFHSKERPLPDFFNIEHPLTKAEADEIRSVQKEFDVIDPGDVEMKRLAIDTNALIDLLERNITPQKSFSEYDELIVPATVIGEYRAGLPATKRGETMLWKLQTFLDKQSVKPVAVDGKTAALYAKVFQELRAKGKPMPQNDIWIAAAALEHGADLMTKDGHFRQVPLLVVITV